MAPLLRFQNRSILPSKWICSRASCCRWEISTGEHQWDIYHMIVEAEGLENGGPAPLVRVATIMQYKCFFGHLVALQKLFVHLRSLSPKVLLASGVHNAVLRDTMSLQSVQKFAPNMVPTLSAFLRWGHPGVESEQDTRRMV